jgi:hypothetical protein
VRIFKSRWFQRFARKQGIEDTALSEAIARAEKARSTPTLAAKSSNSGLPGPDKGNRKATGSSSFSVAAPGRFLCTDSQKSRRANVDDDEERQFKEAAKHVLALTERNLAELLNKGDFVEVKNDEQEVSKRRFGRNS